MNNKLYDLVVERNSNIAREYNHYVDTHREEHEKQRWKHWWLLFRLNWHYRVLKKDKLLITESESSIIQGQSRKPAINGPESKEIYRQPFFRFAMDLMEYDVISFDVFDTLLLRPFKTPQDIFYIVGHRLNFDGYNRSFFELRKNAEINARRKKYENFGHREITIYDIYKEISNVTNIIPEVGVETEFGVELEFCQPNPYMLEVYKILRSQGKRIVITSDMYFPQEYISKMLKKIGIEGYEKLYVSCDYNVSKSNGRLYDVFLKDFQDSPYEKIVHIGDNYKVDMLEAEKKGINTKFYRGVHDLGASHRPKSMSKVIGAFYAGVVNIHIHSGKEKYSVPYEYGYIYGGLYVFGFINWLHDRVISEGIEQIIFLARDGYIYKKAYDMFFDEVDTQYCYWSRHAAMRCDVVENNFEEFLHRYVDRRIELLKRGKLDALTIGELFEILEFDASYKFKTYGLTSDSLLDETTKESVRKLLLDSREELIENYRESKTTILQHYVSVIKDRKKIALIDTGWTGNNVLSLKRLLSQYSKEYECKIWMAGTLSNENQSNYLDHTIDTYLFSDYKNKEFVRYYRDKNSGEVNTLVHELMTQTTQPSFKSETREKASFDIPQVEDYAFLVDMQKGIIDFCQNYWEMSEGCPILRNVSGSDAFAPIRLIMETPEYIQNHLSDMHMAILIGSNNRIQGSDKISY